MRFGDAVLPTWNCFDPAEGYVCSGEIFASCYRSLFSLCRLQCLSSILLDDILALDPFVMSVIVFSSVALLHGVMAWLL